MHVLHPRSRSTGALFTTTLAISFLVVALPHLLPCPVDRRQFTDSGENGENRRRQRKKRDQDSSATPNALQIDTDEDTRRQRECPVPKPGGLVGQIMGFEQSRREPQHEVVVHKLKPAAEKQRNEGAP